MTTKEAFDMRSLTDRVLSAHARLVKEATHSNVEVVGDMQWQTCCVDPISEVEFLRVWSLKDDCSDDLMFDAPTVFFRVLGSWSVHLTGKGTQPVFSLEEGGHRCVEIPSQHSFSLTAKEKDASGIIVVFRGTR